MLALPLLVLLVQAQEPDADGDGLSDFQERHKYCTDPGERDSDGDGKPDGDADERREYAYTIRTRVLVMKPVTPAFLDDDFQDARVLRDEPAYVELEVVHYPLGTANAAIGADPRWRAHLAEQAAWLAPGPTSDASPELGTRILQDLAATGLDPSTLDDRTLAAEAARFLCDRTSFQDGFTSFMTSFADGKPSIPEELRPRAEQDLARLGRTLEEQWQRDLFASGMYAHAQRGSCTSSAIYLCGGLRALGLPTRIVLCIPLVDASDPAQVALVGERLTHGTVRATILGALADLGDSWTSHTYDEVWVDGRWRRLNYAKLGQDTLDRDYLGLMTHVATFRDWSEADMPATVGRRQVLGLRDEPFVHSNPYRTLEIEERFGAHARIEKPPVEPPPEAIALDRLLWTDSAELPSELKTSLRDSFGVLAHAAPGTSYERLKEFQARCDARFFLEAEGRTTLSALSPRGGVTWGDSCWILIPFGPADRAALAEDVAYRLRASNREGVGRWNVTDGLTITRARPGEGRGR